jgi:hypothetical protein
VSMDLIVPGTGEVVDLQTASEVQLAEVFDAVHDAEQQIRGQKRELVEEIARRLDRDGRRSLRIAPDLKLEVNGPTEREWDLTELRGTLAELVAEGTITERKAKACVKWEPRAVWNELRTLLSDPRCKARIEHCFTDKPASRYARVVR